MKKAGDYYLPSEDSYFVPLLSQGGGFQIDHLEAALEYVEDWRCAVDGGAHVGTWTSRLAQTFDEVHAFEPAADTFECLQRNLAGHTHHKAAVMLHKFALGQVDGLCSVVEDVTRPGNTGARFIQMGRGEAPVMTLDSLSLSAVGFVKLDLEGYEYFALLGAVQTLLKCRPVVLVEEKGFGARYDVPAFAASEFLQRLGARRVRQIGKDHVFVW